MHETVAGAQAAGWLADPWELAARAGDHEACWRISDRALAARDPASRDAADIPYHLRWVWDGSQPDGRDVLVRCYHGLGDTLQYARFLPALRARAASVTVEAQPALLPLLGELAHAVAFDPAHPLPPSACDVEIMELSHMLRLRPADVRRPALSATYPPPLPRTAALCWQSGDWDPGRSVPLAEGRAALPGWNLISLQRGPASGEAGPGFLNPGDDDRDILRSASLIGRAELVVTVDSMVAHLAGSLGRPVFVLLKHRADWRWGDGETSEWYPSARLFRQHRPGDWSHALATLSRAAGSWPGPGHRRRTA